MSNSSYNNNPSFGGNYPISNNFNTNTSHPLIPSSQEYTFYKKQVSIHSEDRNILKFPNPAEFEIQIPEDLLNVSALRLISWSFPENYNTFSFLNNNVTMSFRINNPYNPDINSVGILLYKKIFECLFTTQKNIYEVIIEDGFYNPTQMASELTNKFNASVTARLVTYFTQKSTETPSPSNPIPLEYLTALSELNAAGGYTNFVIVYNNVSKKLWFGNICDGFILTNELQSEINKSNNRLQCVNKSQIPNFSDWGLPGNLGLTRSNTSSINSSNVTNMTSIGLYNGINVPRFFYLTGQDGYWLLPNPILTGSKVEWIECNNKINLTGPCYIYMELHGQNCIDETSPFNVSTYTLENNITNGVVNAAFAKIPIPACPIIQWIDKDSLPYKFYYPPAERMRNFYIKLRYHNGELVNFSELNYSFVLEFTLQMPQMLRKSKSVVYPPYYNR